MEIENAIYQNSYEKVLDVCLEKFLKYRKMNVA